MTECLCKNCKYFYRNNTQFDWNKYGLCTNDKFVYGQTWEDKVAYEGTNDKFSYDTDLLLYMDCERYNAEIEVGENFGCIHFEEGEND